MTNSKLPTTTLILFFLSFLSFSQNRILQFQNIAYENGVTDYRINNILQDKDGYLWFGTRLGIYRYNGQTTKTYHLLKEHFETNDIFQDSHGRIWAATTGGLYIFNSEKDDFEIWQSNNTNINKALASNVLSVTEVNNKLWCSSVSGTIISLSYENNKAQIEHLLTSGNETNNNGFATDIIQDKGGTIWISTSWGRIIKYKDSKFSPTKFNQTKNNSPITTIAMDQDNNLWIATNGNGLFKYNVHNDATRHYTASENINSKSITNNIILSLCVDKDNNLWAGTDGGGLNLYLSETDGFTSFQQNNYSRLPISDNSVLSIHQGNDNIIWIGTVHGGVNFFKNNSTILNIPPSEVHFNQKDTQGSQVLEASNGDIWFTAGRNGLRRYRPKTGEVFVFIDNPKDDSDLSGNNVLSLFEDGQNRIWIGTLVGGLNVYDTRQEKFLQAEQRYNSKAIFGIEKDDHDNIWVGSNAGIKIYNTNLQVLKTRSVTTEPNLNSDVITCLYKDVKGDMWVGTSLGLNVFTKNGLKKYNSIKNDATTLSGNRILSIAEDEDLSLLIGTYGFGLNRYRRNTDSFERIGKNQGLNATIISGLFLDDDKNIWCSTNLGLSKIKPDNSIENYGFMDGIQAFQGGSATINKEGTIFMGGPHGLSYFKASDLKPDNSVVPKVFFTSISVLSKNGPQEISFGTKPQEQLIIRPEDQLFSVNFSSSNYWSPKKNIYRYKLEGLNKDWQTIGNQQVLTFSNLKPGEYTLKVSAAKNMTSDHGSISAINITVLPSFWQKTWVKILCILSILGLVLLFLKWRISSISKQRQKLQELVTTKTEEVKKQQDQVYQSRIALLNAEKENQKLSQKKLRNELNFKTEELTNYTLRTIHKNHLLTEIKDNLIVETKEDVPKKKNLKKIVNLIDDSLMLDTDWENFYNLFNQIHTTFIKNLKSYCPKLSDREVRLCALIKLNFNSQHIATLFGISLSSVKVARHRLRKKLNISENQSFEDFFENLN
ncbi:hypothetical protein HCG49_10090 [Arenibacter sp. 6A1]|uniref:ligand-binding sensor domain-containing protein n=1 Tax=Arenibacter sp. 6A1 TaxID=2720391 RepID=UPI001444B062|nr:two-component regulator propeller domain-containing protein [Arenibacter sp. 6A1]NKI26911.1 hypothetical protein [Arenibacter sp. 6A1]